MSKKKKENTLTRRDFVGRTLAASAAFTIVPSYAVSGLGHVAPSDKLNIACIGIGGKGKRHGSCQSKEFGITKYCRTL